MNKTNKEKLMFSVSCPGCKQKFGIPPRRVSAYLDRTVAHYKERFKGISEMLDSAQAEIKSRTRKRGPL